MQIAHRPGNYHNPPSVLEGSGSWIVAGRGLPSYPAHHNPESYVAVSSSPSDRPEAPSSSGSNASSPLVASLTGPTSPVQGSYSQRIKRLFFTGLLILIPLALTVYILVALFQLMDGIFAPLIDRAVGYFFPGVRIPGLGFLLTIAVIFGIGWLSSNVFGRRLIRVLEQVVCKIPVAKSVYGATKGIMEALSHEQREAFRRVVLVEYPKANMYALGFVTGSTRWPQVDERLSDFLLVFVPTTPNPTSGFLLLVPRSEAIPVPFSVEEGVRLVISGGMLLPPMPGESLSSSSQPPAPSSPPAPAPPPSS